MQGFEIFAGLVSVLEARLKEVRVRHGFTLTGKGALSSI
jgi:hypothetical protein